MPRTKRHHRPVAQFPAGHLIAAPASPKEKAALNQGGSDDRLPIRLFNKAYTSIFFNELSLFVEEEILAFYFGLIHDLAFRVRHFSSLRYLHSGIMRLHI